MPLPDLVCNRSTECLVSPPRSDLADHLNLGCGARFHPGWTNVDVQPHSPRVVAHDVAQAPLPFAGGRFGVVYHSHLLEHVPRDRVDFFLKECRRVLRPGGIMRVVVPDLEQIADLYLHTVEDAWQGRRAARLRHEWLTLELLDQMVRVRPGGAMLGYLTHLPEEARSFVLSRLGAEGPRLLWAAQTRPAPQPPRWRDWLRAWLLGSWRERLVRRLLGKEYALLQSARFRSAGEIHQWMYDRASVQHLLASAGFRDLRLVGPKESAIPGWPEFHLDTLLDGSIAKPDSLYMEGRV